MTEKLYIIITGVLFAAIAAVVCRQSDFRWNRKFNVVRHQHGFTLREKIGYVLMFAVVSAITFSLSNEIMWLCDDYSYQYIFNADNYWFYKGYETENRIETLSDVFFSQNVHYPQIRNHPQKMK